MYDMLCHDTTFVSMIYISVVFVKKKDLSQKNMASRRDRKEKELIVIPL